MPFNLFAKTKPADAVSAPGRDAPGSDEQMEGDGPYGRIWRESYPEGVPFEIEDTGARTVIDVVDEAARKFGDKTAVVQDALTLNYQDIANHSTALARFLVATCGIAHGDRVALMSPNTTAYPLASFAILRAGGVLVNVNPLYTPRELEHQLKDSGAETLIVLDLVLPTVAECIAHTPVKSVIVINSGAGVEADLGDVVRYDFLESLGAGAGMDVAFPTVEASDLAVLQYTGGTTGLSKGAMLTHKNLASNLEQARTLFANAGVDSNSVILTVLPLYHIFAFTVNMLMGLDLGAKNIFVPNPRDLDGLANTIKEHKPTAISGVNTLFNLILTMPQFQDLDLTHFQIALGGGTAVQRVISDRWRERVGTHIMEGYGLSETSPVATFNPPSDSFSGTVGLPVSSTDITLRTDDDLEVPIGEPGEICIRGPQVMAGYWNRPDATHAAFTADGYFKTGDIGIFDERGFLRIADRKKDMIIVSGFNVYPNEIEGVIAKLQGVVECAAVGVPDDRTGEAVRLFVVRGDDALTEDAIMAHARHELTAYKVPKQITFLDVLPKSSVGKILRRELRDKYVPE